MGRPLITKPQIPGPVFGVGGPTTTLIKRPIGPCCLSHSVGALAVQGPQTKLPEDWESQLGLQKKNSKLALLCCMLALQYHLVHHTPSQLKKELPKKVGILSQHLWAVPRQIRFWSILKKESTEN